MMTNWIRENEFELTYDGMEIKFTTLRERNIHTDKEISDWCKDGDLIMYSTGEFEIVGDQENSSKSLMFGFKNAFDEHNDANWELAVRILENGIVYHSENYVANILFQSNSIDSSLFNISGDVTICSNRSTVECWPQLEVNISSCKWNEDGSFVYNGSIFGIHLNHRR